jgi:hypothetical protein
MVRGLVLVFLAAEIPVPLTCKCETWFPTTNGGRGSPHRIKIPARLLLVRSACRSTTDSARRRPLAVSFASSEKVTTQIFRFEATTKASKAVSTDVFFNSRLTSECKRPVSTSGFRVASCAYADCTVFARRYKHMQFKRRNLNVCVVHVKRGNPKLQEILTVGN